jgi:hypothetical protein
MMIGLKMYFSPIKNYHDNSKTKPSVVLFRNTDCCRVMSSSRVPLLVKSKGRKPSGLTIAPKKAPSAGVSTTLECNFLN